MIRFQSATRKLKIKSETSSPTIPTRADNKLLIVLEINSFVLIYLKFAVLLRHYIAPFAKGGGV